MHIENVGSWLTFGTLLQVGLRVWDSGQVRSRQDVHIYFGRQEQPAGGGGSCSEGHASWGQASYPCASSGRLGGLCSSGAIHSMVQPDMTRCIQQRGCKRDWIARQCIQACGRAIPPCVAFTPPLLCPEPFSVCLLHFIDRFDEFASSLETEGKTSNLSRRYESCAVWVPTGESS